MILPLTCFGQGKVFTRNMRLQGYEGKITKVVLSDNLVMDSALKDEVYTRWTVNPYEFCTDDEYEKLKTNPEYFFLRFVVQESSDSLSGLACLQYTKGGPDNMEKIEGSFEVLRIPVGYMENDAVPLHNLQYLPAYIDIIQNYLKEASLSGRVAYMGLPAITVSKIGGRKCLIPESDLASDVSGKQRKNFTSSGKISFVGPKDCARVIREEAPSVAIGVAIFPASRAAGSVCYKMVVGTDDHKLYYFSKHHIKGESDAGFLSGDILSLSHR